MNCGRCVKLELIMKHMMQSIEYLAPLAGAGSFGMGYEQAKQALKPTCQKTDTCELCGADLDSACDGRYTWCPAGCKPGGKDNG